MLSGGLVPLSLCCLPEGKLPLAVVLEHLAFSSIAHDLAFASQVASVPGLHLLLFKHILEKGEMFV